MSKHPMEQYLAEEAARPGPTMTITKASYLFLLEQLRAMEVERSAGAAPLDVERLAEAMAGTGYEAHPSDTVQWAGEVAAEYARLSEGTDR